jgi:hypothetical protein
VIAKPPKLDPTQYTVQYELLRSQVIGTAGDVTGGNTAGPARGVGLALLLSEGMPGWLKTVEAVLRASVAPRAADAPDLSLREVLLWPRAAPVWLSSVQRHEVTTLLASLVLSTRPVVHSSSREGYRSW